MEHIPGDCHSFSLFILHIQIYNELLYSSFDGNSIDRLGISSDSFLQLVLNIISYKKLVRDEFSPLI